VVGDDRGREALCGARGGTVQEQSDGDQESLHPHTLTEKRYGRDLAIRTPAAFARLDFGTVLHLDASFVFGTGTVEVVLTC
jgi:hypothetical protein